MNMRYIWPWIVSCLRCPTLFNRLVRIPHPAFPYYAACIRPMMFGAQAIWASVGDMAESHVKKCNTHDLSSLASVCKLVHAWICDS